MVSIWGTEQLMVLIGTEIAKMHQGDIIHGDLTTSNMMLRRARQGEAARLVSASKRAFYSVLF